MSTFVEALLACVLVGAVAFSGYSAYPQLNPSAAVAPTIVTRTVVRKEQSAPGQPVVETREIVREHHLPAPAPVKVPVRKEWSLGLTWSPRHVVVDGATMPVGVEVGRRVIGDLWGTVQGNWLDQSVLVGVRYEF